MQPQAPTNAASANRPPTLGKNNKFKLIKKNRPVFASRLPSIQRPPPRVEKPIISAQLPAQEWLVSGNNWVENSGYYASAVEYGRPSYVVDKDLGSQVHMTFKENEPCFLVFNLRKGYSISALRIRSSWSNGPKRVSLSFSAFIMDRTRTTADAGE